MSELRKMLIIQTASIGDVILTTPLVESLAASFPLAKIDFLLKKGLESLLENHPLIRKTWVWDKNNSKGRNLLQLVMKIRKEKYDAVINVQRFFSSGLITAFSGAPIRSGFDKNPLSFRFTHKTRHLIGQKGIHEIDRNLSLLNGIAPTFIRKVRLYPTESDYKEVSAYKGAPYVCIAPASLWFTKQYPQGKWIEFINSVGENIRIYLLGSKADRGLCENISASVGRKDVYNLAGELTFLQSAALMKDAKMNFVNDSAPLHLASAVNAPVTAIFCSTVTDFGFGPLSDDAAVVETPLDLACRPCGLHGYRKCPEKHFKCAVTIENRQLLNRLNHEG